MPCVERILQQQQQQPSLLLTLVNSTLEKNYSNAIGVTRGFALTTNYKNRLGTHTGENHLLQMQCL